MEVASRFHCLPQWAICLSHFCGVNFWRLFYAKCFKKKNQPSFSLEKEWKRITLNPQPLYLQGFLDLALLCHTRKRRPFRRLPTGRCFFGLQRERIRTGRPPAGGEKAAGGRFFSPRLANPPSPTIEKPIESDFFGKPALHRRDDFMLYEIKHFINSTSISFGKDKSAFTKATKSKTKHTPRHVFCL